MVGGRVGRAGSLPFQPHSPPPHSASHFCCDLPQSLAPTYEKLAQVFANEPSVVIANVDADGNRDLGSRFEVSGFPTIKAFPPNDKSGVEYEGQYCFCYFFSVHAVCFFLLLLLLLFFLFVFTFLFLVLFFALFFSRVLLPFLSCFFILSLLHSCLCNLQRRS